MISYFLLKQQRLTQNVFFFFFFFRRKFNISALDQILNAPPTAELEPLKEGQVAQLDEVDMGMSYVELGIFGRLRKQNRAGPFSMFCNLVNTWDNITPKEVSCPLYIRIFLFFLTKLFFAGCRQS